MKGSQVPLPHPSWVREDGRWGGGRRSRAGDWDERCVVDQDVLRWLRGSDGVCNHPGWFSQARHNILSEREREDGCGGKVAGGDRTPRWRGGEAEWLEKGGWGVALF